MKTLYGVGVGPGDPELVTLKAIRVIREADYIFVPRPKKESEGMAEAIVAEHLAGKQVVYLHLPMGADNSERYREIASEIDATLRDDENGAFITIGDPMVYSTFAYLMFAAQTLGIRTRIVPGIPSFVAASAALGEPLAIRDDSFYLADGSVDEEILRRVQTVCVLKPRKELAHTLDKFEQYGFDYAYLKRCSLPEEEIIRDRDRIAQDRDYMTLLFARKKE
ncbi:uroporphyrin-III C/tetrapyrrole/corrin/porphyrin methyltransferase [Candidatus Moduliflexus flocculans]|uniref:Uroporphyrin-III C/tetrapyrrole/corrin/porphyrin methyltransferase n=1 Tax=Candidatus Moduliflexus flocculans TaxID=1499966 RepID=A0A0S6VRC4_9BACT|nr:uroporphyrin-III C/tetrapyrrole/corrin/porphyrin methyltransferase [Candidatus Moduliflexus flocculans]